MNQSGILLWQNSSDTIFHSKQTEYLSYYAEKHRLWTLSASIYHPSYHWNYLHARKEGSLYWVLTGWTCACFSPGQSNFLATSTLPGQVGKMTASNRACSISISGSALHTYVYTHRCTSIHTNHKSLKHMVNHACPNCSLFYNFPVSLMLFHHKDFVCVSYTHLSAI